MSSDSDLDFDLRTPSVEDQLTNLQHFMCDLTRKLGNMEDRIIQNQDDIYRIQVQLNNQQIYNTKITTMIIYLFSLTLLLIALTFVPRS